MPVLWILAGPNGSGKSTYYELNLKKFGLPFVNPDLIAARINPRDPDSVDPATAQREADQTRAALIAGKVDFVTETVFSHVSKLGLIDEAVRAGYRVRVVFLCTEDPTLNVMRVRERVARGGHSVPLEKIPARYERALANAREAIGRASEVWMFDNSARELTPKFIAKYQGGKLSWLAWRLPRWFLDNFNADLSLLQRWMRWIR